MRVASLKTDAPVLVLRQDCFVAQVLEEFVDGVGVEVFEGVEFEACGRVFGGDVFEDDEEAEA